MIDFREVSLSICIKGISYKDKKCRIIREISGDFIKALFFVITSHFFALPGHEKQLTSLYNNFAENLKS